ncbi:MAG: multidrug ABC transporter ATP-binding protein [Deltaproteobacteria bacterium]|nr:MAG: multidrug ABC transporter ATP-binding protein [Deltaproteobacteria bacterium]
MEAIRMKELSRRFGDSTAVESLSFSVAEGELFGLVGPDGAGKTTVMRLLAGILDPSGGDAWVMGRSVRKEAGQIHKEIGYMSQRFGLYPDLSVLENLRFYADLYGVSRRERGPRIGELLSFANLAPFQDRLAGALSGGMKQKLGLACALVHTPKVLFLDEPTNGVDPVSRRDFWRILYGLLREKVTIFVSTAYLDEAERFQRLALLHRGRLLALGSPEEIKALFPGALFEVRCAEPRRAAAILRKEIAGTAVGLFGERVHVGAKDPASAARDIGKALDAAGIPFSPVQPIEPALEDVFVAAIASGEEARS